MARIHLERLEVATEDGDEARGQTRVSDQAGRDSGVPACLE